MNFLITCYAFEISKQKEKKKRIQKLFCSQIAQCLLLLKCETKGKVESLFKGRRVRLPPTFLLGPETLHTAIHNIIFINTSKAFEQLATLQTTSQQQLKTLNPFRGISLKILQYMQIYSKYMRLLYLFCNLAQKSKTALNSSI